MAILGLDVTNFTTSTQDILKISLFRSIGNNISVRTANHKNSIIRLGLSSDLDISSRDKISLLVLLRHFDNIVRHLLGINSNFEASERALIAQKTELDQVVQWLVRDYFIEVAK